MLFTNITKGDLPITLTVAKDHLRVGDSTHDDALIAEKLEMAVAVAEDMTGRMIRDRSVVFDVLFNTGRDFVPMPVHTCGVSEVSLCDIPIAPDKYSLACADFECRLTVAPEYAGKKLRITARLGYDATTIPPAIKAGILMILGTLYDNESDNIVGRSVSELSLTAEKLLNPWRVNPYGQDYV